MIVKVIDSPSTKTEPKTEKPEHDVPKTSCKPNTDVDMFIGGKKESPITKQEIPIGIRNADDSSRSRSRSGPKSEKENCGNRKSRSRSKRRKYTVADLKIEMNQHQQNQRSTEMLTLSAKRRAVRRNPVLMKRESPSDTSTSSSSRSSSSSSSSDEDKREMKFSVEVDEVASSEEEGAIDQSELYTTKRAYHNRKKGHLFCAGFPTEWTRDDLLELFQDFGAFDSKIVNRGGKRFGFVDFISEKRAELARFAMNGKIPNGETHPIYVTEKTERGGIQHWAREISDKKPKQVYKSTYNALNRHY